MNAATEECMYCGLPLSGEHDGWGHARCEEVFEAYCEAHEVQDNRDLDVVERSLRRAGRCMWQNAAHGHDGPARYCGQPAKDGWCAVHQHEVHDDDEAAADARAALVRRLLSGGSPTPSSNGGTVSDDTGTGETYTHAAWLQWADKSIEQLHALANMLDLMCAQIADDDGDQAQIASIRAWQAQVLEAAEAGRQMVETVNAKQVPVGEAVAQAGGADKTPHKQYADEARSGAAGGGSLWDVVENQ